MESKKANDELYCKGLRPMLGSDTQTFLSLISKKMNTQFDWEPSQQPCVFTFNWVELQGSRFFEQQFNSVVTASINWFTCPALNTLHYTIRSLPRSLNGLTQYSIHSVSEWARLGKTCGFIRRTCDYFHKGGKELKSFKQVAAFYHTLIFIQTTHIGLSINSELWYMPIVTEWSKKDVERQGGHVVCSWSS